MFRLVNVNVIGAVASTEYTDTVGVTLIKNKFEIKFSNFLLCFEYYKMNRFLVTTLPKISRGRITHEYGLVTSNVVRTKHIGIHLLSELRAIFGGKMGSYTDLLNESREEVTNDLIKQAEKMGANAIIGVRYQNSSITPGASEIMIYGTAVKYDTTTK